MRRFVIAYILVAVSFYSVYAQDIRTVANEFMSGSETDFSCVVVGSGDKYSSFEAEGRAKLLGSCYNIETDDGMILISDGKSLWIINPDTEEAVVSSIDDNSGNPYDFTKPFHLLANPQGSMKFSCKGVAPGGNSKVPAEIVISGFKGGQPKEIIIKIKRYAKAHLNSSTFVFDKKEYPGINVTDMR